MPERAVSYRNHSSTAKPVKPRNQTVKVGAPQGTGQTCSCMDLVLMEFGFSLWGIHCRNSLYIFISVLPVCVVWAAGHSWSQQSDGHMDTQVSWAGCPRHCAGTLEQSLIILCNFCFSGLQDSLCGVGVCCPVHSWRFVLQLFSSSYFSGGRGRRKMWLGWCISACWTLGEEQWAVLAE